MGINKCILKNMWSYSRDTSPFNDCCTLPPSFAFNFRKLGEQLFLPPLVSETHATPIILIISSLSIIQH